jgi:hypothetical protein
VFGDKDRGSAVFAAQGQSLQDANEDENDRREPASCMVGRQQADRGRGKAHDGQREDESDSAPYQIAHAAKEERAKGPDQEANGKRRQISDESKRVIAGRIKLDGEHRGERAEDVKVVLLDQRSQRGTEDDFGQTGDALRRGKRSRIGCHETVDLSDWLHARM